MKKEVTAGEGICHLRVKALEMTAFRDKLTSLFNKLTSVQTLSPYSQETFTACAAPFPCFPPSRPLTQKTNSAHSSFCASPQPEFTKGHTLQILSQNYHDTGTVCDFKHISLETHLVHCRIDPGHDRSADDTAADPLNDALSDESSSVPGPVLKKAVASSGNGSLHCRVSPCSTSKRRIVPFLARPVSADAPDAKKANLLANFTPYRTVLQNIRTPFLGYRIW